MRFIAPSIIFLFCLAVDQISKLSILDYFDEHALSIDISFFFNIVLAWNKGVSFSFLTSENAYMPYWLAGFSILVSLFLFIWLTRESKQVVRCGLAFIIAGAMGNAIDRLLYGAVVDFLDFYYQNWHFPTFNIADICINIGVGLILIDMLFLSQKQPKEN